MANRYSTQFFASLHKAPFLLDCNFVVDSANGNGLGLRSLKGPGILNAFMHTSATPGFGNANGNVPQLNPNPAAGTIIVQFQDNWPRSLSGGFSLVTPVSGTPIVITAAGAHIVAGTPYTIVAVGTSTLADWVAIGLPVGIVPAVGVTFIGSSTTGSGTGTGMVEVALATGSGIDHFETIGDPNTTINPSAIGATAYMVINCMLNTTKTQPADGTVISLQFLMNNSSVVVSGG